MSDYDGNGAGSNKWTKNNFGTSFPTGLSNHGSARSTWRQGRILPQSNARWEDVVRMLVDERSSLETPACCSRP